MYQCIIMLFFFSWKTTSTMKRSLHILQKLRAKAPEKVAACPQKEIPSFQPPTFLVTKTASCTSGYFQFQREKKSVPTICQHLSCLHLKTIDKTSRQGRLTHQTERKYMREKIQTTDLEKSAAQFTVHQARSRRCWSCPWHITFPQNISM